MTNQPDGSIASPSPDRPVDLRAWGAWLFDMDGVLTKTALVHAAAWKQAFDEFLVKEGERTGTTYAPFDANADYEQYVDGEPRADGVRHFLAARGIVLPDVTADDPAGARSVAGVGNAKNLLVLQILKRDGVQVYDGTIDLVKALRAAKIPMAVVSASENTVAVLKTAKIADLFDAVVDGVVVKQQHLAGKPAPDSYLAGAKALGVDAARAVVLEDALAGVAAGRAGKFGLVIGVDRHRNADELHQHGADVVVEDLGDLLHQ
jgi:beta-phosphoglucomutase family hydrolase